MGSNDPSVYSCPDLEMLAVFAQGALPKQERLPLESHAARCALCAHWLADALVALSPPASEAERPAVPALRRWAVAAGLLVAVGTAVWLVRFSAARPGPGGTTPGGAPLAEASTFRTGPGREDRVTLPDGSELRVGESSVVHLLKPAQGERVHLRLEAGEIGVTAAKAKGSFRITGTAGEIRILGTRLVAKAFALDPGEAIEGFPGGDVLSVELIEGRIALENAHGRETLNGAMRGLCFPDSPPVVQERGGSRREAEERFLRTVERSGDGWRVRPGQAALSRLLAATYWGGDWEAPAPVSKEIPEPLRKLQRMPGDDENR